MKITMTIAEWELEGKERFGSDQMNWAFRCPACGCISTVQQWKDAGAPEGAVGFSCIGRWSGAKREAFGEGDGPCNYAGGGLIGLNPVRVIITEDKHVDMFEFGPRCKF